MFVVSKGVWPSEDVLAHFLTNSIDLSKYRSLCELGGGMTYLAGITAALSHGFDYVLLTDGNEKSVASLLLIFIAKF